MLRSERPELAPVVADILSGAGACLTRFGWTKTSVSDTALAAGCARATVYRYFPNGKPAILVSVGWQALYNLVDAVDQVLSDRDRLDLALVDAITAVVDECNDNQGLVRLIREDRGELLPLVAFDHIDLAVSVAVNHLAPALQRFGCSVAQAESLIDWSVRLSLSYVLRFGDPPIFDLTDRDVLTRLVTVYGLGGHAIDLHQQQPQSHCGGDVVALSGGNPR